MKKLLSKGLVFFAGFLTAGNATAPTHPVVDAKPRLSTDPRLLRLKQFFADYGSPVMDLAEDFLLAADRNHLDWRLLPSIAIVESGGGKRCVNNNIFGWASAQKKFASVRAGIHHVATQLAHSRLYRGKNTGSILATYNAREEYPALVKSVMRRIDPAEPRRQGREPFRPAYSSRWTP